MSYIFGPVPSRRLGRSLGIDLVPFKTCTYDCIYCQLGRTTCKSMERREWAPLGRIVADLKEKLDSKPDYITLGGSGEPTLYSRLDELIAAIRSISDIPIAVITNGSLLWRGEVRRQLKDADLVIPSLDAGDGKTFEAVNRPHPDISFDLMVDGLKQFRKEFKGQYWLEVFITAAYTDTIAEVGKIAKIAAEIKPDRIQLNTVSRPPAEEYAAKAELQDMISYAELFRPEAEVIADFSGVHAGSDFSAARESVMEMLRRRPCSLDDIAGGLGIHRNEAVKHIEKLLKDKAIERIGLSGKNFYRALK
jgi:wyosine [tRNA(Phe)-imidazoG37] synthetase (radical SAM superfamily)